MNAAHLETLSAMVDGEVVDPAVLAEALADPRAANVLVELAAWRLQLRHDTSRPGDEFYASMARTLRPSPLRSFVTSPLVSRSLAAGLVIAAALLGFTLRPMVEPSLQHAGRLVAPITTNPVPSHASAPVLTFEASPRTTATEKATSRDTPPVLPSGPVRRVRFAEWRDTTSSE
jgi:hypothetical protein